MIRLVERRDLLVSTSLSIAGDAAAQYAETTYGQGGRRDEHWLVREAPERSSAATIERPGDSIVVRGRLAGRRVEAIWSKGRVSGDPLIVTMVEQLVLGRQLDLTDAWNFLFLMGAAVDQGTLDAEGDVPGIDLLEPV
jgi:hypothetical protein